MIRLKKMAAGILAAAMTMSMTLAMPVMAQIENFSADAVYAGKDTYKVAISADGVTDAFAVGVQYDADEVDVVSYDYTEDFKTSVGEVLNASTKNDIAGLITFVCATTNNDASDFKFSGVVAEVVFAPKEGVDSPVVTVYGDTNNYLEPQEKLDDYTLHIDFIKGDADLDKDVDIEDALAVLKNVANTYDALNTNAQAREQADMDENEEITVVDALGILKVVATITE